LTVSFALGLENKRRTPNERIKTLQLTVVAKQRWCLYCWRRPSGTLQCALRI